MIKTILLKALYYPLALIFLIIAIPVVLFAGIVEYLYDETY